MAGGFVRIVFRRPEGAGVVNGPVNGPVNGVVNGVVNGDVNGDVNGQLKGQLSGQLSGQLNDSQKETFEFIKAHEGYNTTKIADGHSEPLSSI